MNRSTTTVSQSQRPGLAKIPHACHRLAIGETKLRELIKAGLLDMVKIGAATRVTEESIDRFIAASTRRTA